MTRRLIAEFASRPDLKRVVPDDLTVLTETVVVKADNDQLPVGEREKFYAEAEGTVNAMKMRAGLYAKNEQEITGGKQ